MMQVLMSKPAYERVAARLREIGDDLQVLAIDADGRVTEGDRPFDGVVDPEVGWVSLDMFPNGPMQQIYDSLLKGNNARWVQVLSAGLNNPNFKAIMEKGVRLSKNDAQAPAIAEYVVAHAFSLLHPIAEQRAAQTAHTWQRITFREIAGTRWVLVGFGAIGTEIAARLKPFGVHLTAIRRQAGEDPRVDAVLPGRALGDVLPETDVVVLACALNEETRGLANGSFFASLKKGAIFINIGRGGLVDEAALRDGLERGQPGHAVLDVFATEPLPPDAWFWDHPQVRVTAHTSNAGSGVMARGDALFLENLRRYQEGRPLRNEADISEATVISGEGLPASARA